MLNRFCFVALFAFLHQVYGREKIRQLWKLGAAEVEAVLGKDWEALDGEFGGYTAGAAGGLGRTQATRLRLSGCHLI